MSVILQQQTFVASDWGVAVVASGTATVTQQFTFAVALSGTLAPGATVTVAEQNASHTILTLTCTGIGTNAGFVLVDGGGNDYLFANTSLAVGSQLPATSQGFANVQAPARDLVWTGSQDTNFTNTANWNDTSNALNPAASGPGGLDTTQFLSGGGTITGIGTAAALQFGGSALWNVAAAASLSASTGVTVGQGGGGTVLINGGAAVKGLGASDSISGSSFGVASVTVDGTGSAWQSAGELVVGNAGSGNVTISNKASLAAAGTAQLPAMALGVAAGGAGALSVTGTGSKASLLGQLNVGQAGAGTVTISNQGTVITGGTTLDPSQGIDVAQSAGGSGSITVTGTLSVLSNTGRFVVGDAGLGGLAILAGATVVTSPGTVSGLAGLIIAASAGAAGSSVSVTGSGSQLNITGLLDVGSAGSAGLQIAGGATVTAGSLDVANVAAAVGQIGLTGAGTHLIITNGATVADDGTGVLSVLSGATFSATSLTIGSTGNSSGAVVVSGAGSVINLSGSLNVGTSLGTGDLTVGPGGAVHAAVVNLQGQAVLEGGLLDPTVQLINQGQTAGGFGTIAAGFIVDEGVIQAGGTKPSQRLLIVQGTVLGGGTLSVNGTAQPSATGVLQINSGGTMELTGAVLNAATTTFNDNLTPTGTYSVANSVIDVNFADAAGVLLLDDIAQFAGTVSTYHAGDAFVVTGGTLSNLGVVNGDTLTFSDTGTSAAQGGVDQIIFASAINPATLSVVNGNTIVACFAEGTAIETAGGPVAVEHLAEGDRLVTAGGAHQTIVWIGQRYIDCARHPAPETVWPVRIGAGAFAANVPARDLYLSPDHAVFVDDVLVPVKLLINGTSIARAARESVTYFHVELPLHDVVLAEGLPVESYLDLGDRMNFASGGVAIRLFPEFTARLTPQTALLWETKACADLVLRGGRLAAIRKRIDARASEIHADRRYGMK